MDYNFKIGLLLFGGSSAFFVCMGGMLGVPVIILLSGLPAILWANRPFGESKTWDNCRVTMILFTGGHI